MNTRVTRKIVRIDEEKCDGCELCIPSCPEGALQLIDGKARLVRDFYCDGLGACIGNCPQGAITVIEREAEAYDEKKVMENVLQQGDEVLQQHLQHLQEHGADNYLQEALDILQKVFKIAENIKDKEMSAEYFFLKGKILKSQKDNLKSKENLKRSLDIFVELAIPSSVAKVYREIGKSNYEYTTKE